MEALSRFIHIDDLKETCKELTAQVEENASFNKDNVNNFIDSINLNELLQLIM